jgi:aryl-alcohol dehydrogenase-like predicted oxidoreductase
VVIGGFLKTVDKEIFVATKHGRRNDGTSGWPQNFTVMRQHIESSLKNPDVPRLFLVQLHCIPTDELRLGQLPRETHQKLRAFYDEKVKQVIRGHY